MTKEKHNGKVIILLHLILAVYSFSGVFSKKAAGESFLSLKFCLFYGGVLFLLGFYAIFWQQIIKRMPLSTAYANKAVTVIWGMVWGVLIFKETVSRGQVIGAVIVMCGIILYSFDSKQDANQPSDAEEKAGPVASETEETSHE